MESTMKRATVVGGSLTGLAAGILLRKIGWEVNIFERSPQSLSDRGAGIVLQQETLELLRLCGAKGDGDVGVTLNYRKYLDAGGSVASSDRMPQLMTSWGLLYSWFERSFPAEHYHLGNEFDSMRQDGSSVTSHFKGGMESKADLLVAADGFRSSIRVYSCRKFNRSTRATSLGGAWFKRVTFRQMSSKSSRTTSPFSGWQRAISSVI
jgi:2-polyprenyl-6-methoxyphenol hydroxylase-like FAD-dependent oxidoreductase